MVPFLLIGISGILLAIWVTIKAVRKRGGWIFVALAVVAIQFVPLFQFSGVQLSTKTQSFSWGSMYVWTGNAVDRVTSTPIDGYHYPILQIRLSDEVKRKNCSLRFERLHLVHQATMELVSDASADELRRTIDQRGAQVHLWSIHFQNPRQNPTFDLTMDWIMNCEGENELGQFKQRLGHPSYSLQGYIWSALMSV